VKQMSEDRRKIEEETTEDRCGCGSSEVEREDSKQIKHSNVRTVVTSENQILTSDLRKTD